MISVWIRYVVVFLALLIFFVLEIKRRNPIIRRATFLGLGGTWLPLGMGLFILYLVIVLILALTI